MLGHTKNRCEYPPPQQETQVMGMLSYSTEMVWEAQAEPLGRCFFFLGFTNVVKTMP